MKIKNKKKIEKISYDPESDVLLWEITDQPIDFAKEIGNIVMHFTKKGIPVLVEILEAGNFLKKTKDLIKKETFNFRVKKPVLVR